MNQEQCEAFLALKSKKEMKTKGTADPGKMEGEFRDGEAHIIWHAKTIWHTVGFPSFEST